VEAPADDQVARMRPALSRSHSSYVVPSLTPADKYTTYDPKHQQHKWRKGVHKVPKWTKVGPLADIANIQLTLRTNPKGF
jgi:hypothetical protein